MVASLLRGATTSNGRDNPNVGPRPFTTGETLYARGREASHLLNLLIAERVVLLSSPSGAGKTSLIQAGLIPRLQDKGFHVLPVIRVSLRPERDDVPSTSAFDDRLDENEAAIVRAPNRYVL